MEEAAEGQQHDNTAAGLALLLVVFALAFRVAVFLQVALPLNHDGCMYLGAARAVVHGDSPIGDVSRYVWWTRAQQVPEYMYPPTLAVALTPLTLLPPRAADAAWLAIVAASCLGLAYALSHWLGLVPAALLVLGWVPTWDTFWLGQINAVIACLVALSIAAAAERKDRTAGVLLAAGALVKITPAFMLPALLPTRRARAVVTAAVVGLAVLALSLAAVRPSDWWRGLTIASAQPAESPYLMSWTALLARTLQLEPAKVMAVLGGALLFVTLVRARDLSIEAALAAASLIPVMAGTMVWPHHSVMALPAFAVAMRQHLGKPAGSVPILAWLAIDIFPATAVLVPAAITAVWVLLAFIEPSKAERGIS